MKEGSIVINDKVLMKIITLYTRESGVRSLEREIANVIRKIAVKYVENGNGEDVVYNVSESDLTEYLGASKYKEFAETKESGVGIVTGLAWTSVGGVTLDVETALLSGGKGDLVLTGSMGDVMKESARIALSVVRARAEKFNIDKEKFITNDVHIHIPEGATPKDGPSAGITLSTALTSIFSGKKVRNDVAMTGEVTLTGRVLAIGGLKEKSLAAYMRGIKNLIIPKENEKDIKDIPTEVKESVKIITVSTIDEVLDIALIND
jgi:ATP-dependent Lon protease